MYPKFSVIIPLKDRGEYIEATLRTCMAQNYPNFEIIVSDDCSRDNTVEVVEKLASVDSRIKLFKHEQHLGMRDNFEFALNQVKEGYVIALGGDDGLIPGCIWKMYDILLSTGRELLTWSYPTFVYPTPDSKGKSLLLVKRTKALAPKIIRSADFLRKIASTFNYQIDECPMFYMKGVTSISLVNRVKSRTRDHSFYYCPTPDGFSGVVLAGEVQDFVFTNEPLSIGGTTIKSQGQNYRRTDKKSREEAEQFFKDNIRRTMHEQLASQPYSPLQTLMTADYLLTAQDLPGWPAKDYFNISFDNLIKRTFRMIVENYYEDEVLVRELKILQKIAEQHNLLNLFNSQITSLERNFVSNPDVFGDAITHSIRLEGSSWGINDIYDAANAVPFISNFFNQSFAKYISRVFINTLRIIVRSRKKEKKEFPKIS